MAYLLTEMFLYMLGALSLGLLLGYLLLGRRANAIEALETERDVLIQERDELRRSVTAWQAYYERDQA